MITLISGIVIDAFSKMRSQKEEIEHNRHNMCLICSQTRDIFERRNIPFSDHTELEHNPLHYIYYTVSFDFKNYFSH